MGLGLVLHGAECSAGSVVMAWSAMKPRMPGLYLRCCGRGARLQCPTAGRPQPAMPDKLMVMMSAGAASMNAGRRGTDMAESAGGRVWRDTGHTNLASCSRRLMLQAG